MYSNPATACPNPDVVVVGESINDISSRSGEEASPGRPVLHYTAQDTWLNDPNGLVHADGTYHLYYQNNPYGNVWGNMSWGHATSTDLLAWVEHPIAIAGDESEDVFSGSIVVDRLNTSGLGTPECPPWVAIYTSAFKEASPHRGTQAQSLAYSLDNGMTWTKHQDNPVLTLDSANFRDPKVIRYTGPAGSYWVMVAVEAIENKVLFFRSRNLRDWDLLSEFGPANAKGGEWECPDLFPLPLDNDPDRIKWVLTVNINPGAVAGGSGGQYFVGDFDGVRFTRDETPPGGGESPEPGAPGDAQPLRTYQWLDWGRDYYAAVSFTDAPDDRRIMIAWMNNWDYANQIPTSPWRSAMTLARDVSLATVSGRPALIQKPILPAPGSSETFHEVSEAVVISNAVLALPPVPPGAALIIRAEFHSATARRFGLRLFSPGTPGPDHGTAVVYDTSNQELTVDRTRSGNTEFHPLFASVDSCPVNLRDGTLTLEIVLDHSSIEVFAQDGEAAITDLIFPSPGHRAASIFAEGGAVTLEKLAVVAISGTDRDCSS
jgi:fructan beta-fructosidase